MNREIESSFIAIQPTEEPVVNSISFEEGAETLHIKRRGELIPNRFIAISPSSDLDTTKVYLNEIGKYPLLTANEEITLGKKIEIGKLAKEKLKILIASNEINNQEGYALNLQTSIKAGEEAKKYMIESNLRLVVSIAKKYTESMPLQDLIQEGNLGLIRAVEKFDWKKGFRFSTYATWWIKQSVQRGITGKSRMIRLSVHAHENLISIRKTSEILANTYGREPTIEELAKELGKSPQVVKELLHLGFDSISLDTPLNRNNNESALGDIIPDVSSTDELALENVYKERVSKFLNDLNTSGVLSDREKRVMELRGLTNDYQLTLDEIGQSFGVTRERIRQLEESAKRKILKHIQQIYGKEDELIVKLTKKDFISKKKKENIDKVVEKFGDEGEDFKTLIKRMAQQYSKTQIASRFGISLQTLRNWCISSGIDTI